MEKLQMTNGKTEYVSDDLDFIRVLWDYCGEETALYFEHKYLDGTERSELVCSEKLQNAM